MEHGYVGTGSCEIDVQPLVMNKLRADSYNHMLNSLKNSTRINLEPLKYRVLEVMFL